MQLRVFTSFGERAKDDYLVPVSGADSRGPYRVPPSTLLFVARRGAPYRQPDGRVLTQDAVGSEDSDRVSLFPTFHAALASLAGAKRTANATMYILEVVQELHVRVRRGRHGLDVKPPKLPSGAWNFARTPSVLQLSIEPEQAPRLRVYRALELPMRPDEYGPFPPGLFTWDPRDGHPARVNVHEALTQRPTSLRLSLRDNLAGLEVPVREETAEFGALVDVLRFDAGAGFPGTQRLLADDTGAFSFTYMHACDVAGDHERLLRLCHLSDDSSTTSAASRFVAVRGPGPWPNRIALWLEPTTTDGKSAVIRPVRLQTVVHRVGQAPLTRDLASAKYERGAGFVVLQMELPSAGPNSTRTTTSILAAEAAIAAPAIARQLQFTLLKALSSLTYASTTHGDVVEPYYETYYAAGDAVTSSLPGGTAADARPQAGVGPPPPSLQQALQQLFVYATHSVDPEDRAAALVVRPHLSVDSIAEDAKRSNDKRWRQSDDVDEEPMAQPFSLDALGKMETLQDFF